MLRNKIISQNKLITIFEVKFKGVPYRAKCDTEDFNSLPNRKICFKDGDRKYLNIHIDGKNQYMHRVIMNAGEYDIVDHHNGIQTNNCKSNLRVTNQSNNLGNKNKNFNKDLPKGIYRKKNGSLKSVIQKDKKRYYVGTFQDVKSAMRAYNKFGKLLFGEFHLKAA